MNTLVNNPGCSSGYRLEPGATFSKLDGEGCAGLGLFYLTWSSKAAVTGSALSTIAYSDAAHTLGFMK